MILHVAVNMPSRWSRELRFPARLVSGGDAIPVLTIPTTARPGHEGRARR